MYHDDTCVSGKANEGLLIIGQCKLFAISSNILPCRQKIGKKVKVGIVIRLITISNYH